MVILLVFDLQVRINSCIISIFGLLIQNIVLYSINCLRYLFNYLCLFLYLFFLRFEMLPSLVLLRIRMAFLAPFFCIFTVKSLIFIADLQIYIVYAFDIVQD